MSQHTEEQRPVDLYDMMSMWVSDFGDRRRLRKMYRKQRKDRIVAKIEGNPVEFGLQLGLGIFLSLLSVKLAHKGVTKMFMAPPTKPEDIAVLWLNTGDLDLINKALKEAAK